MAADILHKVNRLIRQCKEQAGPAPTSPEDVRRYVALALSVAEPVAEELILEAGSRGANPSGTRGRRNRTRPVVTRARFELEWVLPLEPGLTTHVTLFDEERTGSFPLAVGVMAVGHGADEDAGAGAWKGAGFGSKQRGLSSDFSSGQRYCRLQ